jgi:hypothetical protein
MELNEMIAEAMDVKENTWVETCTSMETGTSQFMWVLFPKKEMYNVSKIS